MIPRLVAWLNKANLWRAVIASAATPAYFNATGDINDAANFSCQLLGEGQELAQRP
jgi:predicted acylesterase/phospholipase RssA